MLYTQSDSPQFRQNPHALTRCSQSVSQPRLTTQASSRSLVTHHKLTCSDVGQLQSHQQSADKQNEAPNYEQHTNRPVSQIERFRRERIRKLYGIEERCTAVYRSDARRDPTDTHDKREQQQQIRRLQQQLRQRDRMIMELQKADINKEKHLVTLTSHNMTLTSTLQVLKQQTSHMAAVNQKLQAELATFKKLAEKQGEELTLAQTQLEKKCKSVQFFTNLEPRLRELEQLQDRLIQQNTALKNQKEKLSIELRNLMTDKEQSNF